MATLTELNPHQRVRVTMAALDIVAELEAEWIAEEPDERTQWTPAYRTALRARLEPKIARALCRGQML